MKKTIFLILTLFFQTFAWAEVQQETYAVETPQGVAIVLYIPGSNDSLETILEQNGMAGMKIISVKPGDLPKEDRDFWKFNPSPVGPKIVVDQAKKQAYLNDLNQKKQRKLQALAKFCPSCTVNDLENLMAT